MGGAGGRGRAPGACDLDARRRGRCRGGAPRRRACRPPSRTLVHLFEWAQPITFMQVQALLDDLEVDAVDANYLFHDPDNFHGGACRWWT